MHPTSAAGPSPILRVLVVATLDVGGLLLLDALLPGLAIDGLGAAFGLATILAVLNAVVWPLLVRVALPVTVATLGLAALLLDGLVLLLAAEIEPRVELGSLGVAILVALGLGLLSATSTALLALDDDAFWHRHVIGRELRRERLIAPGQTPGTLFLEIDGLAYGVLRRAIRDGNAPTLASWVRTGSHRLICWETGWSSQTAACQAGLLHGSDEGIPAFRWWDKAAGRMVTVSNPHDAAALERRNSDGHGLLSGDGASRANLMSGNAPHSSLTLSTVLAAGRAGRRGQDYFAYFSRPYGVARTATRAVGDVIVERWQTVRARRRHVEPRVERSWGYALLRAYATVVQLDLQVAAVTADVLAGRPVVYTSFLAYDEVAHHSGVERPETLAVLRRVDRAIARIAAAVEHAPRPYRLVVLSDHGQSQGATFRQRYGETLEQVVRRATGLEADETRGGRSGPEEALALLGVGLTELANRPGPLGGVARRVLAGRTTDGVVILGDADRRAPAGPAADRPEVVVTASGNLGTVSFPRQPGRVTLERIERDRPGFVDALRGHPGVAFVLVRSEAVGGVVLGATGARRLADNAGEGADPLAPFGRNAMASVRHTDAFANCPDVVVNGTWWPEAGEVAAFEELVGSHGGMGGEQSRPFVLVGAGLGLPDEPVVGAAALHAWLVRWRDAPA